MMNRQVLELAGVLAMAACVVASGVWIVEVEHRSRQLFIQAEGLNRELDELQIEWGQLQIEQRSQNTGALAWAKSLCSFIWVF
jgi:cell division protein FtsL